MHLEMFINFSGNCKEAVEFYASVFRSEVGNLMTYGEAPPGAGYEVPEADRDLVMYAGIRFGDVTAMFMDLPTGTPLTVGDNINPTLSLADKAEVSRIFNELKEGGEVVADLAETFFSPWYGAVKDRFGIVWQLLQYEPGA